MTNGFAASAEARDRDTALRVMVLVTVLAVHVAQGSKELSPDKRDYIIQIAASNRPAIQPLAVLQMLESLYQQGLAFSDEEWEKQICSAAASLSAEAKTFAFDSSCSVSVSGLEFHEWHRDRLLLQMKWLGLSRDQVGAEIVQLNRKIIEIAGEGSDLVL